MDENEKELERKRVETTEIDDEKNERSPRRTQSDQINFIVELQNYYGFLVNRLGSTSIKYFWILLG